MLNTVWILIQIGLMVLVAVGVAGFITSWVRAYHKVENIEKRSQQLAVLQPWWFLNRKLLLAEFDYIRIQAIKFLLLYLVPLLILWGIH